MKNKIGNFFFLSFCFLLLFVLFCQVGWLPFRFMYLRSGSMRPTYQPGDLAVVFMGKNIAVQSGDVVLFSSALGPTTHRAVAVENGLITTQGDANNAPDTQKIKQVDGKLLFAIPKVGYVIDLIQIPFRALAGLLQGSSGS
jgi:signal peptidase I